MKQITEWVIFGGAVDSPYLIGTCDGACIRTSCIATVNGPRTFTTVSGSRYELVGPSARQDAQEAPLSFLVGKL